MDAGESCERAVGIAAMEAASLMVTQGQLQWGLDQGVTLMSPVKRHVGEVQAIGIYRLRHRPHTEATRIWLSDLSDQCEGALRRMQELAAELRPDMQHQGGIKGVSR